MVNSFYKNFGPFSLKDLLSNLNIDFSKYQIEDNINDIKDLRSSSHGDITFFHSYKYIDFAIKTKSSYCITNEKLAHNLPKQCKPIIVDNVLLATSIITSKFYPDAIDDNFDNTVNQIEDLDLENKVKHGKNVLIGNNVKIGKNCSIGHNTIIEKNVIIGSGCSIGSNVIIRSSIIEDNVFILDGCIIGKKGFGFFPDKNKNLRYPHIGIVHIGEKSEIGSHTNIDRGSISNTIIGKNSFLDNQIHIAHNCKIGDNCIIAAQVGIAGSSTIGNNVMIGGKTGISGHLKIGNNVQIGGGSGVIKDIQDNNIVMGYPSKNLKQFLKENK